MDPVSEMETPQLPTIYVCEKNVSFTLNSLIDLASFCFHT